MSLGALKVVWLGEKDWIILPPLVKPLLKANIIILQWASQGSQLHICIIRCSCCTTPKPPLSPVKGKTADWHSLEVNFAQITILLATFNIFSSIIINSLFAGWLYCPVESTPVFTQLFRRERTRMRNARSYWMDQRFVFMSSCFDYSTMPYFVDDSLSDFLAIK